MSDQEIETTVLLVDISGSTKLYETVGDAAALGQVIDCLDRARDIVRSAGGMDVLSKGDDLLCDFPQPAAGLRAAREILQKVQAAPLSVHAGLHFGPVIRTRGDIFGDTVNITARLASLAKSGEVLMSEDFVSRLDEVDVQSLRRLHKAPFKGKSEPIQIYSLLESNWAESTVLGFGSGGGQTMIGAVQPMAATTTLKLRFGDGERQCAENEAVSIGRAATCDIVLSNPFVSRTHATVTLQRGKAVLNDQSSAGTYVSMPGDHEAFLRRETLALTGSGIISPAMRPTDPQAVLIHYEIVTSVPAPKG